MRRVKDMASEASTGASLPDHVVKHAAVQVLAALAATAAPLAAKADDVPRAAVCGSTANANAAAWWGWFRPSHRAGDLLPSPRVRG